MKTLHEMTTPAHIGFPSPRSSQEFTMARKVFDVKLSQHADNALDRAVVRIVKAECESRGMETYIKDALYGGCQSGAVSALIYYRNSLAFYKRHADEIHAMLKGMCDDMGVTSPQELFGDKWDADDMFAREAANQNLLAWFGFEESLRRMANNCDIEV